MADAVYLEIVDHGSFARIVSGYKESLISHLSGFDGYGQGPLDRQYGAIESQFAHKHVAFDGRYLYKLV